jgi:uncharacterized protein (UPF0332 family)
MSPEEKTLARLRIEKAREALQSAKVLRDQELWTGAINRCYYAGFYAANALLYTDSKWSKKHSGVRDMLNVDYVRTGVLSRESGALFNKVFELRLDSDYDDEFAAEPDDVTPLIARMEAFVDEVAAIVYNRTPPPLADPDGLKE